MHRLLKIHFPSLTSQTLEVAASGGTAEGEKEEEEEGRGRENERVIRVWHRRGRLTLFSTGNKRPNPPTFPLPHYPRIAGT